MLEQTVQQKFIDTGDVTRLYQKGLQCKGKGRTQHHSGSIQVRAESYKCLQHEALRLISEWIKESSELIVGYV